MADQSKSLKRAEIDRCKAISNEIRRTIVAMAEYSHSTMHWGGALSCTDILAVLYGSVLRLTNQDAQLNDKFLLSKGHAALAVYATMYSVGILDKNQLKEYQNNAGRLTELMEYNETLGFESSGGSLGLGLSYAAGLALRAKKETLDYRVYVLLGDGELDEGSVWEAIMFASHMELNHLTMIIDDNKLQSDGATDKIMPWNNIRRRLDNFGWATVEVDGHNHEQLLNVLQSDRMQLKPQAIIAHTVKGKGISFMENNNTWHDRKISEQELMYARQEVEGLAGVEL